MFGAISNCEIAEEHDSDTFKLWNVEGHPPVEKQVHITSLDGSCGCFLSPF